MGKKFIGSAALTPSSDAGFDLTTKGDTHGFSNTNARIPISTNNFSLLCDSTASLGLKWAASPTSLLDATGKMLYASSANTLAAISPGAEDTVLTMGASSVPAWAAAGGGGGKLELVGTTTTVDTSTYAKDSYHLAFTSIDMTGVTSLMVYATIPNTTNSLGFRFNEEVDNYRYNGAVNYGTTSVENFGHASSDAFFIGNSRLGNTMSFNLQFQTVETATGGAAYIYITGLGTGDDGACSAGAAQDQDTTQAIESISVVEDGLDIPTGGRLTVYKVTR